MMMILCSLVDRRRTGHNTVDDDDDALALPRDDTGSPSRR